MDGESSGVFPAEDNLFEDSFSTDSNYTFFGHEFTINQSFSASLGVAASVWDAAIHLCNFFEKTSLELSGKRVIELGAGTGFVSILAARLGACVTITDLPLVIPQAVRNIKVNTPSTGWPSQAPSVLPLSWGQDQKNFSSDWDLVLGTDIVYLPKTFPLLLDTLEHLCKNGAVVYLSSKMRREHSTQDFYDKWLPQKFNVELVQREPENNINIYRAALLEIIQNDTWHGCTLKLIHRGSSKEQSKLIHRGSSKEQAKPIHRGNSKEQAKPIHRGNSKEQSKLIHRGNSKEQAKLIHRGNSKEQAKPIHRGRSKEQSKPIHRGHSKEQSKLIHRGHSKEQSKPRQK